jgi:hypothetical protein
MLDQLQDWWQSSSPEVQILVRDGGLVLGAFVVGHFVGRMVARGLRARNFDAALRPPGAAPVSEADHGFTPTVVAGLLVQLSIWALAARWIAQDHGRVDIANTLSLIIHRTWGLAALLVAALALGSLLARRLNDCLHGGASSSPRTGAVAAPLTTAATARAAGAGAYLLAVLLVLLTAADWFDWPLTRTSSLALWHLTQQLLVAAAGLFIGALGARWTRDLSATEAAGSPERRLGQYAALAIMGATSVLAVTVLLSNSGILFGLAALAIFGLLLWFGRGYLPDVVAGLQLRGRGVRELILDGDRWKVVDVGLFATELNRAGEIKRLHNHIVLKAAPHGANEAAACAPSR